jgi:hypothetical protein
MDANFVCQVTLGSPLVAANQNESGPVERMLMATPLIRLSDACRSASDFDRLSLSRFC